MAGDSKIWIMALFFLVSFVYKAIKKKRKAEQEARNVLDSVDDTTEPEKSSWGIADLINQFEEQYGVQKEPEIVVERVNSITDEVQDYAMKSVNEEYEVGLKVTNPNYLEEKASHQSFSAEKEEEFKNKTRSAYDEVLDQVYEELDLKAMVIHTAILQRPEY